MNLILGLELIFVVLLVEASEFDDEIYVLHKDKPISTNDVHKQQKKNKLLSGHDSLELSFPLLPEWDELSMNSFDGKMKDSGKIAQEEKSIFTDLVDSPVGKIYKPKKKPKDKFIMTFTEFFIPIMNHKNFDFPSMPRKMDFFEDFFKDFPMKDFDEQPVIKHKTQKRFLDFNPFLSFVRNTSSKITDFLSGNTSYNNMSSKKIEGRKLGSMFQKHNIPTVFLQNRINKTEEVPVCCAGHTECQTNMHCNQGMCKDQHEEENAYITRLKQMANINKLSRIMLFYTVPILLGIGGIIIAIEIIRKHNNSVKQVHFIKQYDPIQNC